MPYKIQERNNKYLVINSETGEEISDHPSRAKAEAHMRALYANEPDAKHILVEDSGEYKAGRRNSNKDVEKLKQIKTLVDDLLSEEMVEEEEKSTDLSYVKSLGIDNDVWAVKAIGEDTIQGYVALWGNSDKTDLEKEYFTKDTDFWDNILSGAKRPLTWDHAQDKDFKGDTIIGEITEMGDDEIGRWYVARLDRSHKYNKAIMGLIKAGKLGTSSDSAPQYVQRVKTGKATWLKTWPLFAAALTDTPAEPRMVGSLDVLKSLGVDLPDNHTRDWKYAQARRKRNNILGE